MTNDNANVVPARYGVEEPPDRIRCVLCPRHCRLKPGQRGACLVRRNEGGRLVLASYGRVSGICVDPIEKKPLYHFLPGSEVLSFGAVGCHLACRFCQNWHLSAATDYSLLGAQARPEQIADEAVRSGCAGVAFTYNDPIPSIEFVVDVANACHAAGLKTVAVTNGYIGPEARAEFFGAMDAANVDLKAFTDEYYRRICAARLQPVLDTLQHIARAGRTWLEVTTLIIPGENDSEEELDGMTTWIANELGPDVPVHFSAFRPSYRMMHYSPTPARTLSEARRIALRNGLKYVYTGNVHDPEGATTMCPGCGHPLILREGFSARIVGMSSAGTCSRCGSPVAGVWAAAPPASRNPTS